MSAKFPGGGGEQGLFWPAVYKDKFLVDCFNGGGLSSFFFFFFLPLAAVVVEERC